MSRTPLESELLAGIRKLTEYAERNGALVLWARALITEAEAQQAQSECPDPDGCLREGCNQNKDGSPCDKFYEAQQSSAGGEFDNLLDRYGQACLDASGAGRAFDRKTQQRIDAARDAVEAYAKRLATPLPQADAQDARAALAKLIELEDMRLRAAVINPVAPGYEKDVLMELYREGLRPAWRKARAAMKGTT